MISIVACCHGAKLCVHAARDFLSQQLRSNIQDLSSDEQGKSMM